ncbi:MAG: polymerase sigma factor RpoE [Polyangiaceae bacterium]|jgi:RNA polymerase sigma-70 factor (ECF subfamily)|nr:polymerase sigma factor RpoE [Polyangiaceae bacterium]
MRAKPAAVTGVSEPEGATSEGATSEGTLTVKQVHDLHGEFVWRTLHRMGIRPPHVEDVYQEVFLVVHRRLHTFNGQSAVTTWLYEICFRVAAGYRRKAHFRREELVPDWSEMETLSSPTPSPERQLVAARRAKQLERILDALPLEYRVVFVMFEVEGLSSEEIAESVGAPIGTVYSRLHRARKRFVRALAKLGPAQMENES